MMDGKVVRAVTVGRGKRFHMDSSINTQAQFTDMLAFGPMGGVGAIFSYNPSTKVLTITS